MTVAASCVGTLLARATKRPLPPGSIMCDEGSATAEPTARHRPSARGEVKGAAMADESRWGHQGRPRNAPSGAFKAGRCRRRRYKNGRKNGRSTNNNSRILTIIVGFIPRSRAFVAVNPTTVRHYNLCKNPGTKLLHSHRYCCRDDSDRAVGGLSTFSLLLSLFLCYGRLHACVILRTRGDAAAVEPALAHTATRYRSPNTFRVWQSLRMRCSAIRSGRIGAAVHDDAQRVATVHIATSSPIPVAASTPASMPALASS